MNRFPVMESLPKSGFPGPPGRFKAGAIGRKGAGYKMSMRTIPPNILKQERDTAPPCGPREASPGQRHQKAFQNLLDESVHDGKPSPGPVLEEASLRDLSRLKLAGFESIDFAKTGSGGTALLGMAMTELSTSFMLKFFSGHDRHVFKSNQGLNRPGKGNLPSHHLELPADGAKGAKRAAHAGDHMELGSLSAQFESGGAGAASIGYDRNGGTSYGTYQISSRQGTLDRFIEFLKKHDPLMGVRLSGAGAGNTGSTQGAFPAEWKKIAAENPEHFENLQHRFIKETHYDPALAEIRTRTGVDLSKCSPALRQVLWSTAVQHGPQGAAVIFEEAVKGSVSPDSENENEILNAQRVIDRIYALRSTRFGSSSYEVQSAVLSRFKQEKQLALNMLKEKKSVG